MAMTHKHRRENDYDPSLDAEWLHVTEEPKKIDPEVWVYDYVTSRKENPVLDAGGNEIAYDMVSYLVTKGPDGKKVYTYDSKYHIASLSDGYAWLRLSRR